MRQPARISCGLFLVGDQTFGIDRNAEVGVGLGENLRIGPVVAEIYAQALEAAGKLAPGYGWFATGGKTYALPAILVEQVLQMKEHALAEARRVDQLAGRAVFEIPAAAS